MVRRVKHTELSFMGVKEIRRFTAFYAHGKELKLMGRGLAGLLYNDIKVHPSEHRFLPYRLKIQSMKYGLDNFSCRPLVWYKRKGHMAPPSKRVRWKFHRYWLGTIRYRALFRYNPNLRFGYMGHTKLSHYQKSTCFSKSTVWGNFVTFNDLYGDFEKTQIAIGLKDKNSRMSPLRREKVIMRPKYFRHHFKSTRGAFRLLNSSRFDQIEETTFQKIEV